MIIAVTGEKGGTGKTTIATNLAGMRAERGMDIILLDTDRQGSASVWSERRYSAKRNARANSALSEIRPVESVQKFGDSLYRTAINLSRRFDDVVIDLPSGDSRETRNALDVADVIVVPIQPSAFDVWTVGEMDRKVEITKVDRPDLRAYCVINRASSHPKNRDTGQVIRELDECRGLRFSGVVLKERSLVRRASARGLTATEASPPDRKAAAEFAALYNLVYSDK